MKWRFQLYMLCRVLFVGFFFRVWSWCSSFLRSAHQQSTSTATNCRETVLTTSQQVLDRRKHTPATVCMASTLTLDSVVKVPFSLHGLLGHDLKQVVGVGDDLCTDSNCFIAEVHDRRLGLMNAFKLLGKQGASPCSMWTPLGGGPARRRHWSSSHPGQERLWPGLSQHYAPPCPNRNTENELTAY